MSAAMRLSPLLPLLPALVAAPLARAAAPPPATGPVPLGTFSQWIAATYNEGGQKICYAFTRPTASTPVIPGRGEVLLSVTERPGVRDEAALTAGFPYAKGATVTVDVGSTRLSFYTAGGAAFARDDGAAVRAFTVGVTAVAHSPAPDKKMVADDFNLDGFTAAHNAIVKACPPG